MNVEKRVEGKKIPLEKRKNTFLEVELGYTSKEALEEANRCLHCKNPRCVMGCPVNIMIPDFISAIRDKNIFTISMWSCLSSRETM